eukprot:m.231865 g.231865  ORF g.231865 m.231865 type:complete len:437 (-) comp18516_c0_seq1:25-1335(-)
MAAAAEALPMKMDRWTLVEVIKFLGACSLEGDGEQVALEHARKHGMNGHKISQCGSLTRCQDMFKPLTRNQCLVIAEKVKEHLNLASPRPAPFDLKESSAQPIAKQVSEEAPITPSLSSCVPVEPLANISAIDISKICISELQWIGGGLGSTGVFILRSDVGTFVAKPTSNRTAGEIYASLLAEKLGIRSAKMWMVNDFEAQEALINRMKWSKSKNPSEKERLKTLRTQAMVLIEFIPGHVLPACAMVVLAGPHRSRIMYELGLVVLLDMVVNNFDRVPLVWTNDGNLDNVIISPGAEYPELCAIDHTLTCIKNADGMERYLQSIDKALTELHKDQYGGVAMKRVRESVAMFTGVEMTREDCDDLCDGIRAGCVTLRELNEEQPGWAEEIRTRVLESLGMFAPLCGGEDLVVDFVHNTTARILKSPIAAPLASPAK